jgi:hypothetical protein
MLRKKKQFAGLLIAIIMMHTSCSDYLNLVPDDRLATIEYAFAMRSEAKKYLFTCYSYMPRYTYNETPEFFGGDEYGVLLEINSEHLGIYDAAFRITRGLQNAANPVADDWEQMYRALRICNVFLENIETVPDITREEREQWIGEVLFLKAFYHFHLVRKWGPVPIIRDNLPITAGVDEVKVSRNTVDECFAYITELLNRAIPLLPLGVESPTQDLGRITRPIAVAFKAKVLVYAASPLFNNNDDQSTLRNHDGTPLFTTGLSAEEVKAKWNSAVIACREAILLCHETNYRLFEFPAARNWSDTIKREMNIRGAVTYKYNNTEQIWVDTQTSSGNINSIQVYSMLNVDKDLYPDNIAMNAMFCPVLKIVRQYYTNHGIPIEEDRAWQGVDPFALRVGDDSHSYYIRKGYTTIQLNFDREPRFYAHLGFDGGILFRQKESLLGNDPNNYKHIENQPGKPRNMSDGVTGYYTKKLFHYEKMVSNNGSSVTAADYLWPLMRLSDLYLLYAEAINEAEGPNGPNSADLFGYIDNVRAKNGLEGVKDSYAKYAVGTAADKYTTQSGMREIIRRERLIELSLEGHRFWDIRRWKTAPEEYAQKWTGLTVNGSNIREYYTPFTFMDLNFAIRDYFWPVRTGYIEQNPNIVQNIGW